MFLGEAGHQPPLQTTDISEYLKFVCPNNSRPEQFMYKQLSYVKNTNPDRLIYIDYSTGIVLTKMFYHTSG